MVWCSATAAAHDVHQSAGHEVAQVFAHLLGLLIVGTHLIGQSCVGVGADVGGCFGGNLFDVGPQLLCAQGTVEADAQQVGMAYRIEECLGRLTAEGAATGVGDGAADHHRQALPPLFKQLFDGKQGSFGIQRVEDSFYQQDIGTTIPQTLCLLMVGCHQLMEGNGAVTRVVHVGTQGGGAVGRTHGAGHKAGLGGGERRVFVGSQSGQPGTFIVDVVDSLFQSIVGLRNAGATEGVGLDDVRARFQVGFMDGQYDVGPCEGQQVIVALEGQRMVGKACAPVVGFLQSVPLYHGAHGAVEHQDAFCKQLCNHGVVSGQCLYRKEGGTMIPLISPQSCGWSWHLLATAMQASIRTPGLPRHHRASTLRLSG